MSHKQTIGILALITLATAFFHLLTHNASCIIAGACLAGTLLAENKAIQTRINKLEQEILKNLWEKPKS